MILPKRAPVRPRIVSPASGEALPLEEEVQRLLDAGAAGVVALLGEAGTGKTTALQHLAAVLPAEAGVLLLDECDLDKVAGAPPGRLAIVAAQFVQSPAYATYWLAPWSDDDLIEYLLALHKDGCGSVMARLRREDRALCRGLPELWSAVLEHLARDAALPDARSALHREVVGLLHDAESLQQTCRLCLGALVSDTAYDPAVLRQLASEGLGRIVRHRPVQLLLAADLIADDLRGDGNGDHLALRLPRELVQAVGSAIAGETRCRDQLVRMIAGPVDRHAMAASILHAAGHAWMPEAGCIPVLHGAYLARIAWRGVVLVQAKLSAADFTGADLRDADLCSARACKVGLGQARLGGALLERIKANGANLAGADLSEVRAEGGHYNNANLTGANLTDAVLRKVRFIGANLTAAVLRGAELENADLKDAVIERADFSGADLEGACLSGLRLRDAIWMGASFGAAQMVGCDLEGLHLPGVCFEDANLQGALLTGCVMPGANFDHACLKEAGLGDVDWEGASLREADLRGATFHMGSTRSGMVGSPIASEGSRTGFYTDDYEEQYYKAPEEIRKANLGGADLRGAQLDGVDFYLVDLRDALYDAEWEQHFRRCGAILR